MSNLCIQISLGMLVIWCVAFNAYFYVKYMRFDGSSTEHIFKSDSPSDVGHEGFVMLPVFSRLEQFTVLANQLDLGLILIDVDILPYYNYTATVNWDQFAGKSIQFVSLANINCNDYNIEHLAQTARMTVDCNSQPTIILNAGQINLVVFNIDKMDDGRLYGLNNTVIPVWSLESTLQQVIGDIIFTVPSNVQQYIWEYNNGRFIDCNMSRADNFYNNHPAIKHEHSASEANQFRRNVRHLLSQASTAMSELKIPFWISSGTLLGWYRQCDVISYSLDADIGVFADQASLKTQLIHTIESHGLQLKMILGKPSNSYQLAFYAKNTKLDIYFFYRDGHHIWNGATKPETGEKYRYEFPTITLCWSTFLNLYVRVPCNTREYLTANYGSNLMEPVKQWAWNQSPPNARPNGRWSAKEINQTVQVFDQN